MESGSAPENSEMPAKPVGIVVCGGNSSRMGTDKSQLIYHHVPQYQFVHNLLAPITAKVLISCNERQLNTIDTRFEKITDLPEFAGHGPIVAVLSAMKKAPGDDLLVIGCDYPFLGAKELSLFFKTIKRDSIATAFYNKEDRYEPLLAWYSKSAAPLLQRFFNNKIYSLQRFLNEIQADQYIPESENSMISVDTPEDFQKTLEQLSQQQ